MVARKAEKDSVQALDALWDSWYSNVKAFYSLQNEYADHSLETIKRQKEWLEKTKEKIEKLENEMNSFSNEWKKNVTSSFEHIIKQDHNQVNEWMNKLEEVNQNLWSAFQNPMKNIIDVLLKSQNQVESAYEEFVKLQKKNREDILKTVEGFTDQQKKVQKALLDSFDSYQSYATKMFN